MSEDVTVQKAREVLQLMYPGLMIAVSCSIHDNGAIFWTASLSKMEAPVCVCCKESKKLSLAYVLVSPTFDHALDDIKRQMLKRQAGL
jgi:hypothetical protein